jgi:ABC-type antimicrobial peptide transport system permease subunit
LGIGLGIGLTQLAQTVPAVQSLLQGIFTPMLFVQAIVIALLLGTIGGIYPAWRAAQLTPLDAMRAESGSAVTHGPFTRVLARLFGNSLRTLWRRPTRTLVTVLGIGIGVGFVVALLAVTNGFEAMFAQLGGAGQMDLMAEQADVADASLSTIDERIATRIKQDPEVKSVSRLVLGFSSAPGLPYFIIFGIDPREEYLKHYRIREGRTLQRPDEIIIGRFAANGLEKEVGDTLRLAGSSFRIVGIYENGSSFEDASGAISLKDAQAVFRKPRQVSFLGIAVHDPSRAEVIARRLEKTYPEIIVSKTTEMTERMQDMETMRVVVNTLTALTLVVGGVVMMNAMLMSVFERTQEIGVLRALGWRKRRVLTMVVVESLALSFLSAFAGIGIGIGLAYLFTFAPQFGQFLSAAYSAELFLQVLLLALALGAIGGAYPAWRAANLRPIEALRYE